MRQLVWFSLVGFIARPAAGIGPPINTDTPITLGLDGRGVRTFVKVIRASDDMDGHLTTTLWPVVVPYNLTTKGVAGIIVPTVFKEMQRGGETVSSSGLGDISIFAKYVVLQIDRHQQTFRLAPKLVLKLSKNADEKEIPALGSGSTDIAMGAVAAWLKGRLGFYGDGLYTITGESNGRQIGNGLEYNLALAYRLSPVIYRTYPARQTNVYLEFNGWWKGRDKIQSQDILDSGGQVLFVAPGIQYIPLRQLLGEISLQLPVLDELNGVQMGPDWTVNAGIRVLLY